tara:strand:- start:566 stop:1264 length:699 start_codon:yes stop_codon:yes gene_type:complete
LSIGSPDRIRGVIFDLDDTLFDCTGQLTEPARQRASAVLVQDSPTHDVEALTELQTDLAGRLGSSGAIREIGRLHGIPDATVAEALETYNRDDVPPITSFPDAIETLDGLVALGVTLTCVTTGRRGRQLAKVDRLGLDRYFSEGQNLYIHDDPDTPKDDDLNRALSDAGLLPDQALSVGDKLDTDVAAGNRIGVTTVRYRHGRQKNAEPETEIERPDHDILRLADLISIIKH